MLNCGVLMECATEKKMHLVDIGSNQTILISLPSTMLSHTYTVSESLSFQCDSVASSASDVT
ncbi:hypothetical protein MtrunA17_Chr1g0162911 [Medicago truncatula]|uniref:Uncharacterized protein n=1 Tax=Medicago truncatula TaxID=3880 RepID=A0A396JU47_MEDTR|nr:hypothetical protein MtrunA17_Chr1g0162911 [Medicago truncatula]